MEDFERQAKDEPTMTGTNIVPFGEYKGQPVEVLAQDRGYTEWLC
jgi:hypothetical protein